MARSLLAPLLGLGLLACAAPAPAPSIPTPTATAPIPAADPVKEVRLGDILPLTGAFADVGHQELWAAQAVAAIVNTPHPGLPVPLGAGAGLPGLGGARLKLVVRDDGGDAETARTIADQMIAIDHVHWLNGDGISVDAARVQPIAEARAVPFSCHTCTASDLTETGLRWFWRSGPSYGAMMASVFQALPELPPTPTGEPAGPPATSAIVACDTPACQQGRREIRRQADAAGIQVVADIAAPVGTPSLAPVVQQLKSADPDLLLLVMDDQAASLLHQEAQQAGWDPRLVVATGGALSDGAVARVGPKMGDGWLRPEPVGLDQASKKPGWHEVNELYKTFSNGQDMTDLAAREVTGLLWSMDAIDRARSVDPDAIAAAARGTHTPASELIVDYGGIAFDERQQNVLATGVVAQLGADGAEHTVWPHR